MLKSVRLTFATTCFNRFFQLKEAYVQNLAKYQNNENVDFVLVNFHGHDADEIDEFVQKTFARELQKGTLKYFRRSAKMDRFHMSRCKNIAHRIAISCHENSGGAEGSDFYIYNLDGDNLLDGEEYSLIQSLHDSTEKKSFVLHQCDGPPILNHSMFSFYKISETYHEDSLVFNGTCGRICVSKQLFKKVGGYNEKFSGMGMDDIDFMIRCVHIGSQYIHRNLAHENLFLPNTRSDDYESNNSQNWRLMDEGLANDILCNTIFEESIEFDYERLFFERDDMYNEFHCPSPSSSSSLVVRSDEKNVNIKTDESSAVDIPADIFDLSQAKNGYGSHHRFGWNAVCSHVHENFIHNNDGILLDLFCERTFFWNPFVSEGETYFHKKPWIGFVHTTPHNCPLYGTLQHLLDDEYFKRSLSCCEGLFVLSKNSKRVLEDFLEKRRKEDQTNKKRETAGEKGETAGEKENIIPVFFLKHPCKISERVFKFGEKCLQRINHIGWHLRDFSAFSFVNGFPCKRLIVPRVCEDVFIANYVKKSFELNNVEFDENIEIVRSLTNEEYDELLTTELIFNYMLEPGGGNLLSECICYGNPIILNRHETFEDYIGVDYPMFYTNLEEIPSLLTSEKILQASKYLLGIRDEFSYDRFMTNFKDSLRKMKKRSSQNPLTA